MVFLFVSYMYLVVLVFEGFYSIKLNRKGYWVTRGTSIDQVYGSMVM